MEQESQESKIENLDKADLSQCQIPQSMDCHHEPVWLQLILQMVPKGQDLLLHRWTFIGGQNGQQSSAPENGREDRSGGLSDGSSSV